jgi:hypothetical protein
MAKSAVIPCSRNRKMNAAPNLIRVDRPAMTNIEIQGCEIYDSAFLADRGCFTPMHSTRRRPGNVLLSQRKLA